MAPLHIAVLNNDLEIVKLLLHNRNIDVNAKSVLFNSILITFIIYLFINSISIFFSFYRISNK